MRFNLWYPLNGIRLTINIETDIIGKYVERLTQPWKSGGLTMKSLAENGFL